MLPFLLAVVIIIAGTGIYYSVQLFTLMQQPLTLEKPVRIYLKPGSSIRVIASQLEQKKLLNHKRDFILWGRLHNQATHLQAGKYIIKAGESLADILERMVNGDVIQHRITLVEGITFKQMLAQIKRSPLLQHTLNHLSPAVIMKKLGYGNQQAEGRFFPSTYDISTGMKDTELLQNAYKTMQQVLAEEWQHREKHLPFKNAYEALILASIVEKETAIAQERPLIAGVFINRLNKNMRLQTDPTVIYGIKNYDGNIHLSDLRKDTPYNTYTRKGLTPTPIAMPGRQSIHAVLHPDKTDMLYFVAYGDGSGRHVFSTNLKDHNRAVDKYQRKKH